MSDVSAAEAYEVSFRRSAATSMRFARMLGVAFVFVQTWMYEPPEGIGVPFDLTVLAVGVAVTAIVISVVGALLARSSRVVVLRVGSWIEIGGDTALVTAITFAFAFDVESQLWALMMLPAVEAAWRHRVHGALVTWVVLTGGYTAREAFAAARYDYAEFLGHSVTYRTGLTLVITFIAALLARSLHTASTEQLKATQTLARLARTDTLTGLANRDHLLDRADVVLASGARCAVVMLDVDDFRFINLSHGHQVGDAVLSAIADHLADHSGQGDVLARTGGNEYCLLMAGDHDPDVVASLASQLQQRVADPVHAEGQTFRLTASAAALVCDGRQRNAGEVERDITLAMYAAKRQGPQGLAVFHPSMAARMNRRTALLHDLPGALRAGQVRFEYQPILHADGNVPAGFEALVRWQHPVHGAIAPLEIIDIARATGIGSDLLHAALDDACLRLAQWRHTLTGVFVTVNVASGQISDVDATITRLIDLIAQHGLDSRSVILELTETDVAESSMPVEQLLTAARRHGVRVAIDDFGREHSSLARLRTLEVDIVKLDRELVVDLTAIDHDLDALRAVVHLVEAYGYLVLAEGIETEQQQRAVTAAGCQLLQGFHFAGPMPADDILTWVEDRTRPAPLGRADVREEARRSRAAADGGSERVVAGNRSAERSFPSRREKLLGADVIELLVPDELQALCHALHDSIVAAGATEPVEATVVRSDGVEVQVEASAWTTGSGSEFSVHALYRDVSERSRVRQELTEQVRRLNAAQTLAGIGSWEWDLATNTVVGSAHLFRIFGLDDDTPAIVDTFIALLHPEDRPWVQAEIDAATRDGRPLDYEARFVRPDGEVVWIAAHGEATRDSAGVPVRLSGTVHDITERKLAELELVRLTITDALTGLGNRTLLDQRLEEALSVSERSGAPLALLLLDLDRFKAVNDTHGHAVGDAVLVELARRFTQCLRDEDTLVRLGGDEFALVLADADQPDATRIAERLVDAASTPIEVDGTTTVSVGASVGVSITRSPRQGIGELRREADRAMYAAKHDGRNRYVVFTADLEVMGTSLLTVRPDEAGAWADYLVELRAEIALRKNEGALPENFRAPMSVRRTLETLLNAIEHLPRDQQKAELALPERVELEEFVSHQSMVHDWADAQVERGLLTVCRSPAATGFFKQLQNATTPTVS